MLNLAFGNFAAEIAKEENIFERYWREVKESLSELLAMPDNIAKRRFELAKVAGIAYQKGMKKEYETAVASLKRINAMQDPSNYIKEKILTYLPAWRKKEAEGTSKGLGFVPVLIYAGFAATALGYVAVKGLSLLKEYRTESVIIEQVKAKVLTIDEAKQLIKASKPVSALTAGAEALGGNIGLYLGLALAAGVAFLGWKYLK